ncbi:hypothetical protein ORJ66_04260 [Pseudoalteromonas tunicata]|uniref:hypothetical protein n=1 Tax=Pseudoalteromonas tunicata TaxID=314281 RepID=UPI00273DC084|nr:hypothetical protein [Pseudoalteromonas tunicata]MDP5212255.1 hypothetical protein [Pseudoalteromonas tunicata]
MTTESNIQTSSFTQPPKWLKPFAWVMVIWNLMGVMAFVMHILITPEQLAALPQAEQTLFNNAASWAVVVFALAVFAGTAGSLALAFGKKFALPLLSLSLIGVLLQQFHSFVLQDSLAVYGTTALFMPAVVVFFAVALLVVAKKYLPQNE